jgi:hypothetical protein
VPFTDGTERLDAAHQSRVGQCAQNVIHRLVGHRREPGETDGRPNPPIAGDQIGHPPPPGSRFRDNLMKEELPQQRSPVRFERAAVVELGPTLVVSEDQ